MFRRLTERLFAGRDAGALKAELAEARGRIAELEGDPYPEERVVWIFGAGRSGSTWLASMLGELPGFDVWREPLVGELFGHLYYERATERMHGNPNFVLGRHRDVWLPATRAFVLANAGGRFPTADWLVVKEPNGSVGAPILSEALPKSRLVFLVRDPRDIMASVLDSMKEGGWFHARKQEKEHPFLREAGTFAHSLGNAWAAFEGHEGPKSLVRYEDLLLDTPTEVERLLIDLGVDVPRPDLERAVGVHSWEKIPEERRGAGKFFRKASPGSWEEDLTPEQIRMVEEANAPLLDEFYR